jgi:hypothetical protein
MSLTCQGPVWWIAHSAGVVHHGYAPDDCEVTTGQDNLDTYANEADYLAALAALGVVLPVPSDSV